MAVADVYTRLALPDALYPRMEAFTFQSAHRLYAAEIRRLKAGLGYTDARVRLSDPETLASIHDHADEMASAIIRGYNSLLEKKLYRMPPDLSDDERAAELADWLAAVPDYNRTIIIPYTRVAMQNQATKDFAAKNGLDTLYACQPATSPSPEGEICQQAIALGDAPLSAFEDLGDEGFDPPMHRGCDHRLVLRGVNPASLPPEDALWDGSAEPVTKRLWRFSRMRIVAKYSDDEPRDERGRWTSDGSPGSTPAYANPDPNTLPMAMTDEEYVKVSEAWDKMAAQTAEVEKVRATLRARATGGELQDPTEIAKLSGLPPETVERFNHAWSGVSSTTNDGITLQAVAAEKFGTPISSNLQYPIDTLGSYIAANREDAGKYLDAVYSLTQKTFEEQGITTVTAYRYMNVLQEYAKDEVAATQTGDGTAEVYLRPLSSWTLDRSLLNNLGLTGGPNILMATQVPVSRVIGTYATGMGNSMENEVILGGGRLNVGWQGASPYKGKAMQAPFPRNIDDVDPDWLPGKRGASRRKDYNPDEARDEHGRWTSGGGAAAEVSQAGDGAILVTPTLTGPYTSFAQVKKSVLDAHRQLLEYTQKYSATSVAIAKLKGDSPQGQQLHTAMEQMDGKLGFQVQVRPLEEDVDGQMFSPRVGYPDRTIAIAPSIAQEPDQAAKTLAHESVHAWADVNPQSSAPSYGPPEEIPTEMAAALVAGHFGVDTSAFSASYLIGQASEYFKSWPSRESLTELLSMMQPEAERRYRGVMAMVGTQKALSVTGETQLSAPRILLRTHLGSDGVPIIEVLSHPCGNEHDSIGAAKAYDPDEPRDERGQWTSGGGSGDAKPWTGVDAGIAETKQYAEDLSSRVEAVAQKALAAGRYRSPEKSLPDSPEATRLRTDMVTAAQKLGYQVEFSPTLPEDIAAGARGEGVDPATIRGYTDGSSRTIWIQSTESEGNQATNLAHEVTHAVVREWHVPTQAPEVTAEGVGSIVARMYGVDPGEASSGYVAGFAARAMGSMASAPEYAKSFETQNQTLALLIAHNLANPTIPPITRGGP